MPKRLLLFREQAPDALIQPGHAFIPEPCATSRTRCADARCHGIRRMCPRCLSGICEQAPDALIQPGHAFIPEPCATSRTRCADARCHGIRRMCPRCLSGICEQAPDALIQPGHAWLIASRKTSSRTNPTRLRRLCRSMIRNVLQLGNHHLTILFVQLLFRHGDTDDKVYGKLAADC